MAPLKCGDQVLVAKSVKSGRKAVDLESNWAGPYVITEVTKAGNYRVDSESEKTIKRPLNPNRVKRYYTSFQDQKDDSETLADSTDQDHPENSLDLFEAIDTKVRHRKLPRPQSIKDSNTSSLKLKEDSIKDSNTSSLKLKEDSIKDSNTSSLKLKEDSIKDKKSSSLKLKEDSIKDKKSSSLKLKEDSIKDKKSSSLKLKEDSIKDKKSSSLKLKEDSIKDKKSSSLKLKEDSIKDKKSSSLKLKEDSIKDSNASSLKETAQNTAQRLLSLESSLIGIPWGTQPGWEGPTFESTCSVDNVCFCLANHTRMYEECVLPLLKNMGLPDLRRSLQLLSQEEDKKFQQGLIQFRSLAAENLGISPDENNKIKFYEPSDPSVGRESDLIHHIFEGKMTIHYKLECKECGSEQTKLERGPALCTGRKSSFRQQIDFQFPPKKDSHYSRCRLCQGQMIVKSIKTKDLGRSFHIPFLFFDAIGMGSRDTMEHIVASVPNVFVLGQAYKLIGHTIHLAASQHFVTIVKTEEGFFKYDGLQREEMLQKLSRPRLEEYLTKNRASPGYAVYGIVSIPSAPSPPSSPLAEPKHHSPTPPPGPSTPEPEQSPVTLWPSKSPSQERANESSEEEASVVQSPSSNDVPVCWPSWAKIHGARPAQKPENLPDAKLNRRVSLTKGDITKLQVDACVNPANEKLRGGKGLDGYIHKQAGPELFQALLKFKRCDTGDSVTTPAFGQLSSSFVIHSVGPIYKSATTEEEQEEMSEQLYRAYTSAMEEAMDHKCASVAFPCISTGIYGYPGPEAALVASKAVRDFLQKLSPKSKFSVTFCLYNEEDECNYTNAMPIYFPLI